MTNEQNLAVSKDTGNILVSASAGSGKTFTMIQRVMRLVIEKEVDVDQILAVTFTEMAALEMKEKLKDALSKVTDKSQQKRLYRQLSLIASSDISTIHSFCAKLIRSYFFKVGLSPDFSVIDEATADIMKAECLDIALKKFYDLGENKQFLKLVDRHASSRVDKRLKELILSAYTFCDAEEDPEALMDKFIEQCDESNIKELIKQYKIDLNFLLEPLLEDCKKALAILEIEGLKRGAETTKLVIADLEILINSKDVYCIKKSLFSLETRFGFEQKLTGEILEAKNVVANARKKLGKIRERFCKHLADDEEQDVKKIKETYPHVECFVQVLKTFKQIYSREKREENYLDFNDLEHFAVEILKDATIREDVSAKYKYIFVDEYQDVNAVQEKIITLLARDNVFMVGDIKQSIYGFRGCRPEFFAQKAEKMKEEGQTVLALNHNFRSANKVIEMVNKIFCYSMTEKYFGYKYKDNAELVSGGLYPDEYQGRATLHILPKQEETRTAEQPRVYNILEEIKKAESVKDNHTASLITKIINEELGKQYYSLKDDCLKQIQYKDIVILTRNNDNKFLQGVVKGLKAHGIPIISGIKEEVCDYSEILMMINALKLVDCFSQDIPLASTLKGAIGGFTDEDLAEIVCFYSDTEDAKNNWSWQFLDAFLYYVEKANTDLSIRLNAFKNYIDNLRKMADFIGAEGVLNTLIEDKQLESYLFAENNGKTKVNRLRKLVLSTVSNGKKLTVSEFLQSVEKAPESISFTDFTDEECVKMMTIHASKGLEFPVVIVCGLEQNMSKKGESGDMLLSRTHGLVFKHYDDIARVKTGTVQGGVVTEMLRRERIKEELRLFYVALTRATYSLHLTVEGIDEKRREEFAGADKFIDYVSNDICPVVYNEDDLEFEELKSPIKNIIIGQSDTSEIEKMQKRFEYQYPYELDTTLPLKTSVTSAVTLEQTEVVHLLFDEPTPDKEKGIIAHKVMENYDFNSQNDLFEQTKLMVENGVLSNEELNKINLQRINNVISMGVFDCLKGLKLYREKAFLVNVSADKVLDTLSKEDVLVQGVIDLMAIGKESAIVIDYKYSSLDKESLKNKYQKQLELYSYAIESVLSLKVEKKIIVNLFTGESVDIK